MKGPDFFIESLAQQMEIAIGEMNDATELDERVKHSQIVQNLTASWGNVMSVMQDSIISDGLLGDYDDDFDEEIDPDYKGLPF